MDQSKQGLKSGVNIITLYQEKNILDPQLKAVNTALDHLQLAREKLVELPLVCQQIIHNETLLLESLIKQTTLDQN